MSCPGPYHPALALSSPPRNLWYVASPTPEVFAVFNNLGAPLTGAAGAMAFTTYKNDLGGDLANPAITEIGGGFYKFTPVSVAGRGICYMLDTGPGAFPDKYTRYVRPEDYDTDMITTIRQFLTGNWKLFTSGGDANHIIFYADDDVTELYRYELRDVNGVPTFSNPFQRIKDP